MNLSSIDFLKDATDITEVNKGHSGAYKYIFKKNNQKYFLKIGNFEINDKIEPLFSELGISHPKIIEWGNYNDDYNYIIEEYIDGEDLKDELNKYDSKFIYEYGFKIGSQYRNLRKVYPDKKVTENHFQKFISKVNEKIEKLKLLINNLSLKEEVLNFSNYLIEYLEKNNNLFKSSYLIYGHTDIKPSNYLIYKKNIVATDIEHTDYKELALSLLWTIARNDNQDEKNLAFARGYLDGLFNLMVPSNILDNCNYIYIYNMLDYTLKYLEKDKYDKLTNLIKHVNENIIDNKVVISEKLKSPFNLNTFKILNDYDITLVKNSYSPDNITFKCSKDNNHYFLKIMKMSQNRFQKCLESYNLLNKIQVPISPLISYGECEYDKYYFVITKFINYPEITTNLKSKTFNIGYNYGNLVAKYLIKLKNKKLLKANFFDKNDLYLEITKCVNKIYENENCVKYIIWSKNVIMNYIDEYIKAFDEEKINLIHGDVKFDNILYDGNDICFVDNESLMYSYDIINFKYNIHCAFNEKSDECYKGFVNGYLKFTNKGTIPLRIHNQVKLLLVYYVLRNINDILENKGKEKHIKSVLNSCNKYIGNDNLIEWLK